MAKLLTLLFISISVACWGQSKLTVDGAVAAELLRPRDTLSTPANAIQLNRLNQIQEKINATQKEFADLLELIFGVKIEEVEWWGFRNGKFLFIIKPPKNGQKTN